MATVILCIKYARTCSQTSNCGQKPQSSDCVYLLSVVYRFMCVQRTHWRRSGNGKFLFSTLLGNLFAAMWMMVEVLCCCVKPSAIAISPVSWVLHLCRYCTVRLIQWMKCHHGHRLPTAGGDVCGQFMVAWKLLLGSPINRHVVCFRKIQAKLLLFVIHTFTFTHKCRYTVYTIHTLYNHRRVILIWNHYNVRLTMNVWSRTARAILKMVNIVKCSYLMWANNNNCRPWRLNERHRVLSFVVGIPNGYHSIMS